MPKYPEDLPPNPPVTPQAESQLEPSPDETAALRHDSGADRSARRTRLVFAASAVGAAAALTGVFALRAADSSSTGSTDAPSEETGSTVAPDAWESPGAEPFGDDDNELLFPAPPEGDFSLEPPGDFEDRDSAEPFSDGAPASPAQPAPQADGSTRGS